MSRFIKLGRSRLTMASSMAVLFTVGCGSESPSGTVAEQEPGFEGISELAQPLTALADAKCTWTSASGTLAVELDDDDTALIAVRASDQAIIINGSPCPSTATITKTTLKILNVTNKTGQDAAQTVILDYLNGVFAPGTSMMSQGTFIALGMGTDALKFRMTKMVDTVTAGDAPALNINGDTVADIKTLTGVESFIFSMGPGNDIFRGSGGNGTGTGVFATAVKVYGGPGTDTLRGGDGDDTIYGDEDNDTFEAEANSTSDDVYNGGADTGDTVSYAARTGSPQPALVLSIDGVANDGEDTDVMDSDSEEVDNIAADVENVTGGNGNDIIIGSTAANTLSGGLGNDILRGKAGADILNGDAGDDTFDEETDTTDADTMNGGAGTDTVDYSARTTAIIVTVGLDTDWDGKDLGTAGTSDVADEGDKVKVDVENVKGSTVGDKITGSLANNTITGGLGNDTLDGGLGDDVFKEDPQVTYPGLANGADVIKGGMGFDTVDYSARTSAVTITTGDVMANDGVATELDDIDNGIEHIIGGSGADTLTGSASDDHIEGNAGADTLTGGDGDDLIEGGLGDDTIVCGAGSDITIGGAGTNVINADCEL